MERASGTSDPRPTPSSDPQRLATELPPSLLVVARDADVRRFLQACLRRWYQIAETASGRGAEQHLTHCPPAALLAGRLTAGDEEALISALYGTESPPVLKLWSKRPPAGWTDEALRYPFTRADLQRAVDRLVYGEASGDGSEESSEPSGMQIRATTKP